VAKIAIIPVDFSVSANRYLEKDYIRQKEKKAIGFDLWALESEKNMRAYHRNFVEKFDYFRSFPPERKQEAIRSW